MNYGYEPKTKQQSHVGHLLPHCDGKKHTNCAAKLKWWGFSSTARVLCTMYNFHKVRLLMSISVYKCSDVSMMQFIITVRKVGIQQVKNSPRQCTCPHSSNF